MAMLSSYRRVLEVPGARLFWVTSILGRFPISMAGLGIVLLVQAATGSYGLAGAVSAAYMVANAALAVVQGRLVDTIGQARVLTMAATVFGVAMVLLVTAVEGDWPLPATYALAALAGATLPQVGSCVRARWSYVLSKPGEVQTAYALESVADEVVFIVGPILVALLATTVHPVAGLAVAVVAGVGGSLAFAAQRSTEPPAHPHDRRTATRARLPWRTVVPLAVVCLGLGVLFGAVEVGTVAFAEERGSQVYAGPLLAAYALGSLLAGVVSGVVAWRRGPETRVRWGTFLMAAAMLPLSFIGSVPLMALVLFVGGMAIAPTLVAALSVTQQAVPRERLVEGMSIMHTGLVAGVAPGATISGVLVDSRGASAAFLVPLAAGLLAALAALTLPRRPVAAGDSAAVRADRS